MYAIGDLGAGTFQLAVQSIAGLHSAPAGVPSGTGGDLSTGLPVWLLASMAVAGTAIIAGGAKASRQRG